ncbi:MAG TPA: hypothetical protein VL371_13310 [Gemmataceae bacterium]|jgi:hypothetical protein|nr:hypothetical protein [Gemmataceae bacterium]
MTTDIKLGMVVGLGLVLTVAVTYYSKSVPSPNGRTGNVVPSLPSAVGGAWTNDEIRMTNDEGMTKSE